MDWHRLDGLEQVRNGLEQVGNGLEQVGWIGTGFGMDWNRLE